MNSMRNTATILVVDDDELNRRFVSVMLRDPGHEILQAENGRVALEIVDSRHVDIVLLDINMPVMDGIEALRRLRERFSLLELPIIMFTADDEERRIVEMFRLGANDFLAKPVKTAVASARIKAQLAIASLSKLKDDVLRFASHDLKKPMLVMSDILETAREVELPEHDSSREIEDYLTLLESTNRRMQDVVHGFLDQNRLQVDAQMHTGKVDLNELMQDARDNNYAYAQQKQIHLQLEMDSRLPAMYLDSFKVRQVLDNLIGNAIKFCANGAAVKVRSLVRDDEVVIEVIDNGPGLTQEDYTKLFRRGVTLSNRPTGGESSTGIGLPLCKQMIEATGGQIGAKPNHDGGAVFWFSYPAVPAQNENVLKANGTNS